PGGLTRLLDGLDDRLDDRLRTREPIGPVVHTQLPVDGPGEELRASQVDADHTGVGHRPATIHRSCRSPPTRPHPPTTSFTAPAPACSRAAGATGPHCSTSCAAPRPARRRSGASG